QVAVTDKKCMTILPNNDKRRVTQKVVVGDKNGVLQCFGIKKRDVNSIFKLLPGPPISSIQLGGALGTPQDKIFVASGSDIRGYSRKGKKFLDFNSNLTEAVANLWISGSDLIVGGQYVFNHFSDCVDQGYYLASDKINDIMCFPVNRKEGDGLTTVLACNDHVLRNFNESVTAVQGGVVGSLGFEEVVVSTYSGWVTGLTTEHLQKKVSGNFHAGGTANAQDLVFDEETERKLETLRSEVELLQQQVENERTKHMQRTSKAVAANSNEMTHAPTFHVNDRFVLSPSDSSYKLSIEVQTAIDHIVLQSDVPIDLLDVESTSAVVSYTKNPPNPDGTPNADNFLLATYRCQANTTRLEVTVRSIEGQYGHLQAYIVPRLQPKTCVLRRYPIKPLSLHQRVHDIDESRAMSSLKLIGQFSLPEVHSWFVKCLPDLPDRTPTGDTATLHFRNIFLETQLVCTYRKGEAQVFSDNISTISILKDYLSREATLKKIALNIQYEVNDASMRGAIQLFHPKLDEQLMLAKKVQLLDALQELQTHEGNMEFLAPEYQQILEDGEDLKIKFKKQPARLERLYGMVTDLFIDKYKFKGINVKQKIPQLLETLDNYDQESLIEFFQQT
uniref:Bardet-Biedl syndrome 7 protein homolog n=1 Tax=Ciona savignyi TaxID=51511 RepID=H2Y5K2_CIOSA